MLQITPLKMNYPAASSGVLSKALNAPRGGEYNPCPPLADSRLIINRIEFKAKKVCNTNNIQGLNLTFHRYMIKNTEMESMMKFKLIDLIDIDKNQSLLNSFCDAVGIAAAIIDLEGEVLVGSRWQRICTDFHRVNERTCEKCIESDTQLANELQQGKRFSIYRCRNGLTDAASPIVIEGKHLANAFVGQFLLEPPDLEFFRRQAVTYGFEEMAYLDALSKVPIVRKKNLPAILDFLTTFAEMVAMMGLEQLRQIEAEEALRGSEEKYRTILESIEDGYYEVNIDGNFTFFNNSLCKIFGLTEDELMGKNFQEFTDQETSKKGYQAFNKIYTTGKSAKGFDWEVIRKDGTKRYVEASVSLIKDAEGKLIGFRGILRDITKRKRAEEMLKESKKRFQQVTENAQEWVWEVDAYGLYTYASPVVGKVLGYKPKELVGKKHFYDLFHPEDKEQLKKSALEVFAKKGSFREFINRNIHKNGDIVWSSTSGVPVLDSDENLLGYRGADLNITERKRAEEKLDIQRAQIKSLFDYSSEAMALLDLENHIIDANLAFEDVFGYSVKEAHGKVIEDLICPERFYHTESKELDEQSLQRIKGAEIIRMRKDGKEINVRVSAGPIKVSSITTGRFVIFDDITERKQAEETLRFERNKVLNILDSMEDGVYIVNQQYDIQYVNPVLVKDFGPGEGVKCYSYFHDRDEVCPWCKNQDVWAGKTVRWEWHSSKNQKTYDLIDTPLKNLDGSISKLEIFRDITDRKQAEEERAKLETQLQQAKKMETIGILAGGVAHDLNNILSGIISYPELLLMDLPEDSPLRKPLLTIKSSGERAAVVVQDLLTMARRGVISTEIINLNSIISKQLKSPEYEKLKSFHPNVDIKTNLEKDLLNIKGSTAHLGKTVFNLISNAAEAMPDGGKVLVTTENLYIDRPIKGYDHVAEGDYVIVTVSDTGIGISEENIERIFEPFYTKKVMGRSGSGLGMSVVWGTVKDHNGYIDIESTKGKGTTFTLSIEDYMGKGESILIVDDVEEQRDIASVMLKKLGYSVTSVSSGEEAIEYMKDNSVDLLVLDMIMDPGIDGLDTYKKILELHPKQKAIIASGFSETDRVKKAKKLGAGAYVKKPYVLEKIGLVIKEELER
jgi:PAS domain S-box-containing protein